MFCVEAKCSNRVVRSRRYLGRKSSLELSRPLPDPFRIEQPLCGAAGMDDERWAGTEREREKDQRAGSNTHQRGLTEPRFGTEGQRWNESQSRAGPS